MDLEKNELFLKSSICYIQFNHEEDELVIYTTMQPEYANGEDWRFRYTAKENEKPFIEGVHYYGPWMKLEHVPWFKVGDSFSSFQRLFSIRIKNQHNFILPNEYDNPFSVNELNKGYAFWLVITDIEYGDYVITARSNVRDFLQHLQVIEIKDEILDFVDKNLYRLEMLE